MVLKRVGVWSAAKLFGAIYAALGLIFGVVVALFGLLGAGFAAATRSGDTPAWLGAFVGIGAIVFLPILYGLLGLVFGALAAALYNLFSGFVGGLEVDLRPSQPTEAV
jgi:hypothetical protein